MEVVSVRIIEKNSWRSGVLTFAFCGISAFALRRNNFKVLVRVSGAYKNSIHISELFSLALNCYLGLNYCLPPFKETEFT